MHTENNKANMWRHSAFTWLRRGTSGRLMWTQWGEGNFITNWATMSFSRKTLLHSVALWRRSSSNECARVTTIDQAAQLASLKPQEWKSGAVGHMDYETRKTEQRDTEPTVNKEGEDPARRHCIRLHHVSRWRVINPLKPELNPICYLLALLGAHHFLHGSRIRVKLLTFRRLMSYIYGAPILDVSRSHTTTQHSR